MKIALLGGSFNPIHRMHTAVAQAVCEEFALDEVWLLPTATNPFKLGEKCAGAQDRVAMCKLAAAACPSMQVCDAEAKDEGVRYTVDTLRILKSVFPEDEFYFILGADTAREVTLWKDYPTLCTLTSFILCPRAEHTRASLQESIEHMRNHCSTVRVYESLNSPPNTLTSTLIRQKLLLGERVDAYLLPEVLSYIKTNHVYYTLPSVRAHLKQILSPKRFFHSQNVARRARTLARLHGVSATKAYFAGLIHDCAKELDEPTQQALLKKYGAAFTPIEQQNPSLRHQTLGRLYAIDEFGVQDEEILAAVAFHTSARPAMSQLEQVIFLADLTSDDRTCPEVEPLRMLCRQSLINAMLYALNATITHVQNNHKPLDERALQALEWFQNEKAR